MQWDGEYTRQGNEKQKKKRNDSQLRKQEVEEEIQLPLVWKASSFSGLSTAAATARTASGIPGLLAGLVCDLSSSKRVTNGRRGRRGIQEYTGNNVRHSRGKKKLWANVHCNRRA